jgi:hypothetical protein
MILFAFELDQLRKPHASHHAWALTELASGFQIPDKPL